MTESLFGVPSTGRQRGRPDITFRKVFHRAALQHGIITAADAASLGVPTATLRSSAHRGALVRVSQGVYRLKASSLDGLTLLMAKCRWACGTRWALTGSAALWWLCDGTRDDRWQDVCPTVTVRVPVGYRTRRERPATLTLRYDLTDDTPVLWDRGFALGPLDDALVHCADEFGRMTYYSTYSLEIALGRLARWSGELFVRGAVTRAEIFRARERVIHAFEAEARRSLRRKSGGKQGGGPRGMRSRGTRMR